MRGPAGRAHSPVNHTTATDRLRAALRHGPVIRARGRYTAGGRPFQPRIVDALLASGEAVRVGTGVIAADMLRHLEAAE